MEKDIQETKEEILNELDESKMNKTEAIEICEEYGWEVVEGKFFLETEEDNVVFKNDKELIDYAEMLKKERS